jgi:hypothetical protein
MKRHTLSLARVGRRTDFGADSCTRRLGEIAYKPVIDHNEDMTAAKCVFADVKCCEPCRANLTYIIERFIDNETRLFNAIGDGGSSLVNLFFLQGRPMGTLTWGSAGKLNYFPALDVDSGNTHKVPRFINPVRVDCHQPPFGWITNVCLGTAFILLHRRWRHETKYGIYWK